MVKFENTDVVYPLYEFPFGNIPESKPNGKKSRKEGVVVPYVRCITDGSILRRAKAGKSLANFGWNRSQSKPTRCGPGSIYVTNLSSLLLNTSFLANYSQRPAQGILSDFRGIRYLLSYLLTIPAIKIF